MEGNIMDMPPGYEKVDGVETLYVQILQPTDFWGVTTKIQPPLARTGGAAESGCYVCLPTGERLCAVDYHSDIDGWRKQILLGAEGMGLLTGEITGEDIVTSDGRTYGLSECLTEFY
ncbi:MAG: hypothetical protein FWH47_02950 [Methanomassiliicoccaceae archaeon]|nr:hypothetical protein [Methanomassiliicoccaceae archaeon]